MGRGCMKYGWVMIAWLTLIAGSVRAEDVHNPDPWEGFNRSMFAFNETMDGYVFKPLAQGYRYITPEPVERSVGHFFSNLGELLTIANDLGQLKFGQAASDTARFLINSTVGFFGIFDVATHIGLPKHKEDLGQTLGYWGVPSGPYLVLPFLGPSTVRDFGGNVGHWYSGLSYRKAIITGDEGDGLLALEILNLRASVLDAESMITGDRYVFLRSFYLQRREFLINDGKTQDDFGDEFDDWDDDLDAE